MTVKKFIETFVSNIDLVAVTVMDAADTSRQMTAIAVERGRQSIFGDKSAMKRCPLLGSATLITVTAPAEYDSDLCKYAVNLLAKTTMKQFDAINAAIKNGTIKGQCYDEEDKPCQK